MVPLYENPIDLCPLLMICPDGAFGRTFLYFGDTAVVVTLVERGAAAGDTYRDDILGIWVVAVDVNNPWVMFELRGIRNGDGDNYVHRDGGWN